jgi:hypothetical protein
MHRDVCKICELKPGDRIRFPGDEYWGPGYKTVIRVTQSPDHVHWFVVFVSLLAPKGTMFYTVNPNTQVFVIKGHGLPNRVKNQCSSEVWSAFRGV